MPTTLTIIGMGACGVAAFAEAVARSRYARDTLSIHLVERDRPAGGLAFGTDQPGHLLNTESRLMGLYDREPGHFRDWLSARREAEGAPLDPDGVEYPPRREYRAYMHDVLAAAMRDAAEAGLTVEIHRGEAVAIEGDRDRATIRMADGTGFASDVTLLTIGTPQAARFADLDGRPGYFALPWPSHRLIDGIDRDSPVAILGSSLSAIDTVMTLLDVDHRGPIHLVSKDGMLPRVEIPAPGQGHERRHLTLAAIHRLIRTRGRAFSIVDLYRLFRREAEAAVGAPIDWAAQDRTNGDAAATLAADIRAAETGDEPFQRILTAARHDATTIWNLLSDVDQRRFGQWLAPHFATARFVMPMVNARRMAGAFDRGLLHVHGDVGETVPADDGGFVVRFADGGTLASPVVVNATGTAMTLDEMKEPLIHDLLARGWLRPHPAGGAIAHRATCRIISADRNAPRLYAVGQLLNGELRDTNAVWFNVECAARAVDDMLRRR